MNLPTIHDYVKNQETLFETEEVQVGDNWFWNFRNHVQMIFHLKNGKFFTGANDFLTTFKNIMHPILRLSYWTEDIEVKEVTFFIESSVGRVLSFFLKRYHDEVYVRKNDLDTLFDQISEDDIDYGGVLLQRTDGVMPEVVPLTKIAFCDQTDITAGPIGFKFHFSPGKIRQMAKVGWGDKKNGATITIEDMIAEATDQKDAPTRIGVKQNNVTGKAIEVYIVKGDLPEHYLEDNDNFENWFGQVHVIAFYNKPDKTQGKAILYRKKSVNDEFEFYTSKEIPGRALGESDGEELIHPQIWTNCLEIWKHQMIEAASKVPLVTDDPNFASKNNIQEMDTLQITEINQGSTIRQIPTAAPANIQLFSEGINNWYNHAQLAGAAYDPLMGKEASSGTTFRGQERVVAQGRGPHDRRRGKRAKFIEKLYRKIFIPDMVKEITSGTEFMSTLSSDELMWVAEQLAENEADARIREAVLEGKTPSREDREVIKSTLKQAVLKKGNKQMLKVIKGAFDGIESRIGINISGKQKDLALLSDKVLSIFQYIFANLEGFKQAMQIPALAKSFNDILEFSGMQQADFQSLVSMQESSVGQMMPAGQMVSGPEMMVPPVVSQQ